tara:strand:- start:241 stop:663 length:423 start_codon:yes stop_codon:yes gene_type:complete
MISFNILPGDVEQINDLSRFLGGLSDPRKGEIAALLTDVPLGITVTISKTKQERSRQQERYYRKWSREFAKFCGMTPDELHDELLCRAFGSEEISTKFGIKRRPLKRSGDTNRSKYSELIDILIMTAAEMGFAVPAPKEE